MAPGLKTIKKSKNVTRWHLETGYGFGSADTEFPIRVVDSGRSAALDITVTLNNRDFEYQCRSFDQGFRVVLSLFRGSIFRVLITLFRLLRDQGTVPAR